MLGFVKKIYLRFKRLSYRPILAKEIIGSNNTVKIVPNYNYLSLKINGDNNNIYISPNASIGNLRIYILGNNHNIQIEDRCYIADAELWIEDNNCLLTIGKKTTIEEAHLAITEDNCRLEIGEDCMLSKNIEIRTGDSHSIIDNATGKRINPGKSVYIKDHVWIGAHVKILKGVTVENNSVVGTGAIVTKDVMANSIASGIPARIIKSNINWDRGRL